MVTEIITKWSCNKCGRLFNNSVDAVRHEKICRWEEPFKRFTITQQK